MEDIRRRYADLTPKYKVKKIVSLTNNFSELSPGVQRQVWTDI